ncbi:lipopolysaccharide biosynthesis protein [Candidatus Parcubacteria bacterium]|nr:MAG: lipopolysaccharide biosynthesis protein [Candidatus Parcubacteria bacterium]
MILGFFLEKPISSSIKSGMAIILASRLLGIASAFLFNAVLARSISQAEMGSYFLILNIVTFFSIFARLGLENVALKIVSDVLSSKDFSILKRVCRNIGLLFCFSALATGVGCWFGLEWLFDYLFDAHGLVVLIPLLCGMAVVLGAQLLLGQILRAFKKFWACSLLGGTLGHFFNFVIVGGGSFFFHTLTLRNVVLIMFINLFVLNLVALFLVVQAINDAKDKPVDQYRDEKVPDLKTLINMSVPLCISQISLFISGQSDIWLLSAYLPPSQVALYGAAAKLVLLIGVFLTIANGILPPFISDFRTRGDMINLQNLLRKVATITGIPAIILLLVFVLAPEKVLFLAFGPSYVAASNIVRVLSVGQLVNVMVGTCGYVLIMFGFNREVMSISLFFGVIMVSGTFMALETGGGITAVAFICSAVMVSQQLTLLYWAFRKCSLFTAIKFQWIY